MITTNYSCRKSSAVILPFLSFDRRSPHQYNSSLQDHAARGALPILSLPCSGRKVNDGHLSRSGRWC